MSTTKWLAVVATIAFTTGLSALPAHAQTRPAVSRVRPVTAVAPPPAQPVEPQQKCLRALNGACTNPASVEEARLRAVIIPAAQVSYLGTPAGTFGGEIPFERFFQDNPLLYGLPTFTLVTPCCTTRTK